MVQITAIANLIHFLIRFEYENDRTQRIVCRRISKCSICLYQIVWKNKFHEFGRVS